MSERSLTLARFRAISDVVAAQAQAVADCRPDPVDDDDLNTIEGLLRLAAWRLSRRAILPLPDPDPRPRVGISATEAREEIEVTVDPDQLALAWEPPE